MTDNFHFLSLFEEFASSFLSTSKAEEQLRLHRESVEAGRRNFHEISAAAGRGDDVADLVLSRLLPRDARRLMESSGWIRPEDLRRAATAVLGFIHRVHHYPEQLPDACAEFAAIPYIKGIQAGMLSPILNALRPDEFAIVNNRVRRVLHHFTGRRFSTSIADYPQANDAVHELLGSTANDMLRLARRSDLTAEQLFDLFAHWLVSKRKLFKPDPKQESGSRYWKLSPGEIPGQWEESRRGGFIAMQGEELGDISTMTRREFNQRRDLLAEADPRWTRAKLNQIWRFSRILPDDRIIVNDGTRQILGAGIVTGSYYYVPGERYGHRLPVRWDEHPPTKLHRRGWRQTLLELDRAAFSEAVQEGLGDEGSGGGVESVEYSAEPRSDYRSRPEPDVPEQQPVYTLEQCADETGFDIETLGGWARAIERKGQAIFYGPPGTGKTFVAMRLASHLAGGGDGFVDVVQFHPAYAYEDFVQGIRPQPGPSGGLEYPLVPGRFIRFCERASRRTGRCVLVIDEINRANLARVFGELMYLLEYRQQEIVLAGGHRLAIPANVRIIGTMNTADRSIALVDHAFRRRFAFLELMPRYDVLERYHRQHNPSFNAAGLIDVLQEINRAIGDRHYEIGISYFLRPDISEHIEEIWRTEIETYLDEYFFDQPERGEVFRWESVGERIGEGKKGRIGERE